MEHFHAQFSIILEGVLITSSKKSFPKSSDAETTVRMIVPMDCQSITCSWVTEDDFNKIVLLRTNLCSHKCSPLERHLLHGYDT